jgi:hypothetical protein
MHTKFWFEKLKASDHANDIGADGKIVWEGVDWVHLVQDRDQWRAVMSTVMNLRVP